MDHHDIERQLVELFGWVEPTASQRKALVVIRTAMSQAARVVLNEAPHCPDQVEAIRLLRQANNMAAAAVVKPSGGQVSCYPPMKLATGQQPKE